MSPRQAAPSIRTTEPRSPKEYEEIVFGLIVANEEKDTLLAEANSRADMAQEDVLSHRAMLLYALRQADPEKGGMEGRMAVDERLRSLVGKANEERSMRIKMETEVQSMRERLERFILGEEKGKVLMTLEGSRGPLPLSPEDTRAVRRSQRARESMSPKDTMGGEGRNWRFSASPHSRKESLTISLDCSADSSGKARSPFEILSLPREGTWSSATRALLFPPSPGTKTSRSKDHRDERERTLSS